MRFYLNLCLRCYFSYKSAEAQETHRVAAPTAALFKAFGTGLLAGPPTTNTLPPVASFQRAGLTAPPSEAVVILTTFGYQPGKTEFALEGWKALVAHAEGKEPGALAVDVTEDAKGSKVHSVQVFDSAASADAHVNGQAIKANREHNGSVRTGERNIVRVKIAYGFLGK
jgi:quinol monooxygenase YgiN